VQRSLEDIDDAAAQQERLIRVLLSITRADSGRHRLDLERLDLATLLADIVAARAGEGSRPVDVRVRHSVPLHVLADRAVLTSILDNLIRNACEYAPADSTPVIRLGATPRAAFVSVSNLAPTLAAEDAALLFDPFWRKDPSHAPGAHLGLGLSLARSFADLLGARIDARLDPGGVLTLRLRLPVEGGG
jgi:signal transduction histidine kinase